MALNSFNVALPFLKFSKALVILTGCGCSGCHGCCPRAWWFGREPDNHVAGH